MNQQAIGIIDSNIGGLTILKELQQRFPYEDFIYLDIKRIEYIEGLEFEESINELLQILLNRNVKLIVILCDKVANLINQISIQVTIPIINLASATVKYVNDNYENKNMLF